MATEGDSTSTTTTATTGKDWWVVNQPTRPGGPRGPQATNYELVESSQRPVNAIAGPFSKQDAQNYLNSANAAGNFPSLPNPLAALGEIAHWAGVIVTAITDVHLYISLGWLFLGITLIWLGVALWLKVPQKVAGIATTVAASRV